MKHRKVVVVHINYCANYCKPVNFKEKMYAFPQDKQNCLLYMGVQLMHRSGKKGNIVEQGSWKKIVTLCVLR